MKKIRKTKNERKNKILKITIGLVIAISSMFLSFYLIVGEYNTINIVTTLIASLFCSILIFWKTNDEVKNDIKKEPKWAIVFSILAIIIIKGLFNSKGYHLQNTIFFWQIDPFRFRFFCIAMLSAIYYFIFLGFRAKKLIL